MNLKQFAICVILAGTVAASPLRASGEMAGTSSEPAGTEQPWQGGDEPAEAAVKGRAATGVEGVTGQGAEEKSWWKGFLHSVGIGADPQPGETVEKAEEAEGDQAEYIIGAGDQIGISVWRDENLSRTVVVLPDGKISFPLVGEVVAGGKTVSQLKQELESKLSRYIADTGVTVEVKQSNSMIIYIVGRVNAPGRQILLANTNVLQALAMVGGPNPFADKGGIKIFRKEGGKTVMFPFNYDDVSEGRHLETNIELKRGDVIIVP